MASGERSVLHRQHHGCLLISSPQGHSGKTVVTMMPGIKWTTPNSELMAELESNLGKIRAACEAGEAA